MTDEELASNGDFDGLYRRWHPTLVGWLTPQLDGDRATAEDLVQETFVRVWRHLENFNPSRKFSTWIFTIATNLLRNEFRNRKRNPVHYANELGTPDEAEDQPEPLDMAVESTPTDSRVRRRELVKKLREGLRQLPPPQRRVLLRRHWRGWSYERIAKSEGICLGTTKSRLNRGRQKLTRALVDTLDDLATTIVTTTRVPGIQ